MAHPPIDDINMSKAQSRSYAFHFFFAAGKGCLFPFLTIYLRFLGLNPVQVGAVMCLKAVASFVGAPCGGRCATRCSKHRSVLMFSIFILLCSYLLMTLIPISNSQVAKEYCNKTSIHYGLNAAVHDTQTAQSTTITTSKLTSPTVPPTQPSDMSNKEQKNSPHPTLASTTNAVKKEENLVKSTTTTTTVIPDNSKTVNANENLKENDNNPDEELSAAEIEILKEMGYSVSDLATMSEGELDIVIGKLAKLMQGKNTPSPEKAKTNNLLDELLGNKRKRRSVDIKASNGTDADIATDEEKTIVMKLWDFVKDLKNNVKRYENGVFAAVLVIVGFSELLSSPIESISDELWFDFLDGIDMVEKFGQQKLWACLGVMVFPVLVTGIIYNTPCLIFGQIPHNSIHFYAFALLMGISFICAFVYPIFTENRKVTRRQNACKGLLILFGDCHAAMCFLSVIVMGLAFSCMYNWMFWRIQDLGGTELVMGVCILVGAISDLVMLICHRWFTSKVTHAGAIIMALILMALRFVYYSFVTSPWLMVIGEAFQGFTVTLMWHAIQGYPQFRLNPHVMDRSAYCVMVALHSLFGLGVGSAVSGYIYNMFGMPILYQGCAVLLAAWCLLFGLVYRCAPRQQKVRYAKLLQEDEQSDEESVIYEDDWLEVAMKSKQ